MSLSDQSSNSNAYEFSVSELAGTLKRTIEETFGHVRVRGELGRVTIAKSGHCYLDIKDDKAVINSIIWKGQMSRLSTRPEEGMEVIVTGKLTTYPGRSNYQLIIDSLELAGEGALMALFEKRKKALAAEGLFDADRKQDLPFMPKVIGVVTSPTGAVIRDILHRITDRFPAHVIVWPSIVQGKTAAPTIAAGITGFNHGWQSGAFPKPDVLIVARGGGSLEDLWCFNEEVVVRAVAASDIPVISAVGHETDWTLVDYVADYRAPTPTGAAEVAVPVLEDWQLTIEEYGVRLARSFKRNMSEKQQSLMARKLPKLTQILSAPQQRLDLALARLPQKSSLFERPKNRLSQLKLPALTQILAPHQQRLIGASARLRPEPLMQSITREHSHLSTQMQRAQNALNSGFSRLSERLARQGGLLEAYSYQGVLARGYALVTDDKGQVMRSKESGQDGDHVTLTFADGGRDAVLGGDAIPSQTSRPMTQKSKTKPRAKKDKTPDKSAHADKTQMGLF